jgi:SAM-dependent methyltransferase
MRDPKERFSDRAEDYRKYRPGYPSGVLDVLRDRCGLGPASRVADLGSGTGILTAMLLGRSAAVYAVEPNAAMRTAAEEWLGGRPGFVSVAGSAEATGLPDGSVDLVTAAQAFHWFDAERTRMECRRILSTGGRAALIWNDRQSSAPGFQAGYESLLRGTIAEYRESGAGDRFAMDAVERFFSPSTVARIDLDCSQDLDWKSLRGRFLSSSYAPKHGSPEHGEVMDGLERLFERHATGGRVRVDYITRMFVAA